MQLLLSPGWEPDFEIQSFGRRMRHHDYTPTCSAHCMHPKPPFSIQPHLTVPSHLERFQPITFPVLQGKREEEREEESNDCSALQVNLKVLDCAG